MYFYFNRVENPGEGLPEVFAKIPRGVKAFRKNFGFYWQCFGICLGGVLYLPVPLPPVCIYVQQPKKKHIRTWTKSLNHVLGPVLVGDAAKKYENSTLGNSNKMCQK